MKTWLYHPEKAPDGLLFDNEQLRERGDMLIAQGWVDTVRKFPGGIFEGRPVDLGPLPVAHAFDIMRRQLDQQPIPDRSPEEIAAIEQANGIPAHPTERAKPKEVLPDDFDDVDSFMAAYVEASCIPRDMPKAGRDAALKAGLEQYMLSKHGQPIDRRKGVDTLRQDAMKLDDASEGEAVDNKDDHYIELKDQ